MSDSAFVVALSAAVVPILLGAFAWFAVLRFALAIRRSAWGHVALWSPVLAFAVLLLFLLSVGYWGPLAESVLVAIGGVIVHRWLMRRERTERVKAESIH